MCRWAVTANKVVLAEANLQKVFESGEAGGCLIDLLLAGCQSDALLHLACLALQGAAILCHLLQPVTILQPHTRCTTTYTSVDIIM